ncbi:PAS domain S-box protein [Thermodesulfobacteriota bacterium]
MLIKKYLGQIMAEMEFVTKQQLDEALQKQKEIMRGSMSSERSQRVSLVSEARLSKEAEMATLLGQVLTDMGYVSKDQIELALIEQEKSFEAHMSLENERLGTAIEISSIINSTINLAEVLNLIMRHVNRLTNSVASTMMLIDEQTDELVFSIPTGPKTDELTDIRIPSGQGIAGWVVKHEQSVLVHDVQKDSRFYNKVDETSGFETKSVLCVPLKAKTKMIGVLEVINKTDGGSFTENDELLLNMFGSQAAVAIENARLHSELNEQLEECRKVKHSLRESEEKYRHLFEMESDAIFLIRNSDGQILEVNNAGVKLYGFSREELLKMKNTDLSDEPDETRKAILKKKKEIPTRFHKKKDGTVFPVEITGNYFVWRGEEVHIASIRDITRRKKAEEGLKESETKFRSLFNLSPQAIALTDIEKGRLIDVNEKFCEVTQYTKEEAVGFTTTELGFYTEKDRFRFISELKTNGEVNGLEMDFKAKDGSILNALMFARIIQIAGEPFILTIFPNLTEQKRLQSKLEQAQKMESLGTLAGGIAHDFNNLLMGIQGRASLMLVDTDSSHSHFEHLKGIEDYVKSAADLNKQLLGFARSGKYEVKPIDLNALIDGSSHMFGRTKKEIKIHRKYQEAICAVEMDKGQIEQVLLNLYVNAWQAMPGGGDLYIQTENIVFDENYSKPYQVKPGIYVKISVTDTGVGMDEPTRKKIFDPFFTTKERERGTGLGLASAYGIIKNHGGGIDVYSEKGQGTTFNIYLPASEKEAVQEKKLHTEVLQGTETVLLVDDEDMIIEVGRGIIESLGYEVLIAKGGKEAIEIYQKNRDRIDMVILDMIMPELGGGEVYDRLKKVNPDIKVLLSSGYSINGEATEILERGCDGFIQKPFNMETLSKKIRGILD